jgi:hypothetical protein
MPFVEKRLISPTSLTTSASTALYTVPTGYTAIIKQIVVTNTTGTAATFTMYIGAASAGNALFSGTSVAANDTVIINLSQVLGTGEILRALSGTNAALNLTVSGVENDGPLAQNAMYIADNAITSAKIADGAIINADINASAAISYSKLSLSNSIVAGDITTNAVTRTKLATNLMFNIDLLVVAGGGPGGWDVGGGGGAGGFIFMRGYQIWLPSFTSVPVVVGAGGVAALANHPTVGTSGGNSSFGSIVAFGGGYGASYSGGSPVIGGSGGGGGGYTAPTNGAMGFIGQGFAGGTPSVAGNTALTGSGGGGAGGPGVNGILNSGGFVNGGNGAISNISGSNVTYCTGGKGGSDSWTGGAAGGANTGNGGDGAGAANGNGGYNGGSGIVIVRYLTSDATGLTVTGGTATTDGSYTVRTFSTVGSTTFGIA